MPILPQTKRVGLRIAIVVLCILYLAEAVMSIRLGLKGHWGFGAMGLFLWLPLALGLWRLVNIARIVALVIQWILFVIIPLGALSPFAAMDGAWRNTPLWVVFGMVIAVGSCNCYAIFVLTKLKDQFHPLLQRSA